MSIPGGISTARFLMPTTASWSISRGDSICTERGTATTNGLKTTNRYVCYSSTDLTNWTPHGEILKDPPPRMYFRPYVKFNARTRKYVLWYNVGGENKDGVAVSDRPEGPFTIQNPDVHLKYSEPGHGRSQPFC